MAMGSLARTVALTHLQAASSDSVNFAGLLNVQYLKRCTQRNERFESTLIRVDWQADLPQHYVFAIKFHNWRMPDRLLVVDLLWRFCGKHRRFVQGQPPKDPRDAWHFRWFVTEDWQPFCSASHHRSDGGWIGLGATEDAMIDIRATYLRSSDRTHLRAS